MSKKLETYANIDPLNLLDLIKYFWLYKIFLIIPFFISIIISLVLYLTLDDTYVYEIKLSPVSEDKVRNYISTVEIKIPNKPHGFTADITKQPLPYNYYSSQLITPSGGVLSNGNLFNIYIDKLLLKLNNESINEHNIKFKKIKNDPSYLLTLRTKHEKDFDKMLNFIELPSNLFYQSIIELYKNKFNQVKKELKLVESNLKKMEDDLKDRHELMLKYKINFLKKHLEIAKKLQIKKPDKFFLDTFNRNLTNAELFNNDQYYNLGSDFIEIELEKLIYYNNTNKNNYKFSLEFINLEFQRNYQDNYLKILDNAEDQIIKNIVKTDIILFTITDTKMQIDQTKNIIIITIFLLGIITPLIFLLSTFSIFGFKNKI